MSDDVSKEEEDYLWDPKAKAAPSVQSVEARVSSQRLESAPKFIAPKKGARQTLFVALGALAAVLAIVLLRPEPLPPKPTGPVLTVKRNTGPDAEGLRMDRPLETGIGSATVELGYGQVYLAPNSKLRLVKFEKNEHRLALDVGQLHAVVDAPPRLFNVDVPGGRVVDLGCEYTLSVRDDGSKEVVVETGYVELEGAGRRVTVPAGARTSYSKQGWPRTPVDKNASAAWSDRLREFEDDPVTGDASALVAAAGELDTVSLWNVLPHAPKEKRGVISARIKELTGAVANPWSADELAELKPAAVDAAWNAVVERRDSPGKNEKKP
jgi:FecR protein